MTTPEIYARLKERFAAAIGESAAPARGDAAVAVDQEALHDVCAYLRGEPLQFDFLRLVSGLDLGEHLAVVYHLRSMSLGHELVLRAALSPEKPRVRSVADVWPAADWLERETFDMFGIVFEGHPDLRRILLPADWVGHPLRKDYREPDGYHEVRNG